MSKRNCLWMFPANRIIQNLIFLCVRPMCLFFGTRGSSWPILSGLGEQQIHFIICIFNGWIPGFQDRNFLDFKISNNLGNLHTLQRHKAIVSNYMC